MKSKEEISLLLNELNDFYNQPHCSDEHAQLYSKIALLELCGWLEQSLDHIVLDYTIPKLTGESVSEFKDRIDDFYGFEYKKHFRNMLIQAIGFIKVEELEIACSIVFSPKIDIIYN